MDVGLLAGLGVPAPRYPGVEVADGAYEARDAEPVVQAEDPPLYGIQEAEHEVPSIVLDGHGIPPCFREGVPVE